MTEQEYLRKIESDEPLTESEVESLVHDDNYKYDVIPGECKRWTREMTTIVKLCDRYFSIVWEKSLTEIQDDDFWGSIIREVKPQKRVITVTDWIVTKNSVCKATSSD